MSGPGVSGVGRHARAPRSYDSQKPWVLYRGVILLWDHTMGVFDIGMAFFAYCR